MLTPDNSWGNSITSFHLAGVKARLSGIKARNLRNVAVNLAV